MNEEPSQPLAARPNPPRLVGATVGGRYRVHELLASGGMCDIYKARQVSMDRWVALKVMRVPTEDSAPYVQWFYREMRAAARIQHPNTVRVYDFGQLDDGGFWMAMELLQGRTLEAEITTARRFPPARVVNIAMQIAKALNAAHREEVIHRDLKGDNILLIDLYGERDVVKVVDFGIASMPGPTAPDGLVAGTPEFMSPEQALGYEVDARADLYALGVLLYQMSTGRLPFEHKDARKVLSMQVHRDPVPPSRLLAEALPELLEALILDLLRKDPALRPPTADDVLQRLAACAAHPSVSRRTHGRWEESSADIVVRPEVPLVEAEVVEPAGPTIVCAPRALGLPPGHAQPLRRAWVWGGACVLGLAALAIPMGFFDGGSPAASGGRGALAVAGLRVPHLAAPAPRAAPTPRTLRQAEPEVAVSQRAEADAAAPGDQVADEARLETQVTSAASQPPPVPEPEGALITIAPSEPRAVSVGRTVDVVAPRTQPASDRRRALRQPRESVAPSPPPPPSRPFERWVPRGAP